MRILNVNWARIWDGASNGGGVNGYCQSLALSLVARGHDVISVCSGRLYLPAAASPGYAQSPASAKADPVAAAAAAKAMGPCHVRRYDDWFGIKVFEIANSPVVAPAIAQFAQPLAEVSSPELERTFADLVSRLRPDVVHFHNLEGFSADCVSAARRHGARVIFSLHNYHTICPQVYLMQGHRRPCFDSEAGHACASCIEVKPPAQERAELLEEFSRAKLEPMFADAAHRAWKGRDDLRRALGPITGLKDALVGWFRSRNSQTDFLAAIPPIDAPGAPLAPQADPALPRPGAQTADETRGQAALIRGELNPPRKAGPGDPEWRPLENTIFPEPAAAREPNEFGRRRAAMVEMLSGCDRVIAVSTFVARKFASMGVREDRLRTLHIGTRLSAVVRMAPDLIFDPPPFEAGAPADRPVRMVFMGYNNWYKGLPMLADTLAMLEPEYLGRIDLHVHAKDGHTIEWLFRRMEPRLAGLHWASGYHTHDIPWICGGKDLGLVTSVWWDNAPQTVFEFFACGVPVLAANLGGIPDFVRDGQNGLLFRGNDREHLARRLREVLDNPSILTKLRAGVRPPKEIDDHAAEMERVYQGGEPGAPEWAPPSPQAAAAASVTVHGREPAAP